MNVIFLLMKEIFWRNLPNLWCFQIEISQKTQELFLHEVLMH